MRAIRAVISGLEKCEQKHKMRKIARSVAWQVTSFFFFTVFFKNDMIIVSLETLFKMTDHTCTVSYRFSHLSQICSQDSCAARCTAQSAHTTPTPLMCSVICPCLSQR